jgi:hypothetical protein
MNSESASYEKLVVTGQVKVDAMRKSSSKVVQSNKSSLKRLSTEPIQENRKHRSHFSKAFSLERSFFKSENVKDNSQEESKDAQKKLRASPQESIATFISNYKANAKDKDSLDKEDKSEEKKISEPPARVDECYYLQLKDGDDFKFQESSYNLHTDDLIIGSKVRIAIGFANVNRIKCEDSQYVTTEDIIKFGYDKMKIVDAVILPSLQRIMELWYKEKHLSESTFGNE